jgi:N-methylhydantoinase B
MERPVEAVLEDVKDGYVSLRQAEQDYGVVLDPETLEVVRLAPERTLQ